MKLKTIFGAVMLLLIIQISISAQTQEVNLSKTEVENLKSNISNHRSQTITLPYFDGKEINLILKSNQLLGKGLEKKFPNHKNYRVSSPSNSKISGFLSSTPTGIFYTLNTDQGLISLRPSNTENQYFLEKGFSHNQHDHICQIEESIQEESLPENKSQTILNNGDFLKIYRMALVISGEFYENNGNDDDTVLSWVQFSMDGLNTIYQKDLAMNFEVGDRLVLYNDSATDIFIPDNDGGDSRPSQAASAIEANFELDEFDIGHVLHTYSSGDNWSGGGIARLNALCIDNSGKGAGWSGSFDNQRNGWINLFAHEVGHMCGAKHTFNGTGGSCTDNISENTAYEIGSGSTIMSYARICGQGQNQVSDNTIDNYFHSNSLEVIINRNNTVADCYTVFETNNIVPSLEINPCSVEEYKIPMNTPFRLAAQASESNADQNLTYAWEQYDEDGEGSPTQGLIGLEAANLLHAPLFRNFAPTSNPERIFPRIENILSGVMNDFEVLPLVEREITMRMIVRDNFEGGGAIAMDEISIDVENGPFEFISPSMNTESVFDAGTTMAIDWETNGSDDLCDKVSISLSTNGGTSFDIPIADDIDYSDGAFDFNIPAGLLTNTGSRIKIECMDYSCFSFFIISEPFTINSDCEGNSHSLCDTDDLTLPTGDPLLALNMETNIGTEIRSVDFDILNTDPVSQFVRRSVDGDCQALAFASGTPVRLPTKTYDFVVSEDASYEFNRAGGGFFSIYEKDLMDENNVCAGWIQSNALALAGDPNGVITSNTSTISVELKKCTNYTIVANGFSNPTTMTILLNENPIIQPSDLISGTNYTFALVDAATNTISHVQSDSDLTNVEAGGYDFYGIQYLESIDPQTWIGLSFTEILLRGDCYTVSSNHKSITIEEDINDPCAMSDLSIAVSATIAGCQEDNGTAMVTISGGVEPYTIIWSNNMTTSSISNLASDTYIVTVTDEDGCEAQASVFVDQVTLPLIEFTLEGIVLSAEVSGGSGSYAYEWFFDTQLISDQNNIIEVNEEGIYLVAIEDLETGCVFENSFEYIDPCADFTAEIQFTNITCNGANDGSASLNPINGEAPFSYSWTNPDGVPLDDLQNIENLISGQYEYEVLDANQCTTNGQFIILEPAVIEINIETTNESILGMNDASITTEIGGGTGPYNLEWTGPDGFASTSDNIEGLNPGTYCIVVTDQNNCMRDTCVEALAGDCPESEVSIEIGNITCFEGNDGTASLNNFDSERTYDILWSTDETTPSIENLGPGDYEVVVTDDLSCSQAILFTVSSPEELTLDIQTTNESGLGLEDGTATAIIDGGTGEYTFEWIEPTGDILNTNQAMISNLAPGGYCLIVSDENDCSVEHCFEIIAAEDPCSSLSVLIDTSNATCADAEDGEVFVAIEGAAEPVSVMWSTGETGIMIENLAIGTYEVTVIDGNNCESVSEFTITSPDPLESSLSTTNESTLNAGDGIITSNISGGTGNYTYMWSNNETTPSIMNLIPGEYCLTITDTNNCTETVCSEVLSSDDPCTEFMITVSTTDVNCFGGSTGSSIATTEGGATPISYEWSTGDEDATISNLPAGTYEVTATDANQCTAIEMVTINSPDELNIELVSTNESSLNAGDGSASAQISGGTAPYEYSWINGDFDEFSDELMISDLSPGQYCFLVSDANDCQSESCVEILPGDDLCSDFSAEITGTQPTCFGDTNGSINSVVVGGMAPYLYTWSDGSDLANLEDIAAGTYSLTLTDANDCSFNTSLTISEPDALTLDLNTSMESMPMSNDGMAAAQVNGGTAPYTYQWSSGDSVAQIANLAPGNYCVTATDSNGCSIEGCVDVFAAEDLCADFNISLSANDILCFGETTGSISPIIENGLAPYTYLWNNGDTTESTNDLAAGEYSIIVTDANDCSAEASIELTQANELTLVLTANNESNSGVEDGSISATVNGGTGAYTYTYTWDNGTTTANIDNLAAGTYCLTVSDENDCTQSACITVEADADPCSNTNISLEVIITNTTCHNASDGAATVIASDGAEPYQYTWSNGQDDSAATNLASGEYTIIITDANGCEAAAVVSIDQPDPLSLTTLSQTNESMADANDGSISAIASGGTAPYSYTWSNGGSTPAIDGIAGGTYDLLVVDNMGCEFTQSFTIGTNATATGTARVQFIHAAFDETVSIQSDQGNVLSYLACTMATAPIEVPAGINQTYTLSPLNFWAAFPEDVDLNVSFEDGESYIAVLHGTFDPADEFPLSITTIPYDFNQQASQEVLFNLFNSAYNAPILSLESDNGILLSDTDYGNFSSAQSIASVANEHQLNLSDGDGNIVNTYFEDFSYWKTNSAVFFTLSTYATQTETQLWVALSGGGSYQLTGQNKPEEFRRAEAPKKISAEIFPNPSTFLPTIRVSLDRAEEIDVEIFHTSGKLVQQKSFGILDRGQHHLFMENNRLHAGNYIVRIRSANDVTVKSMLIID